jgi:hypothetical protein
LAIDRRRRAGADASEQAWGGDRHAPRSADYRGGDHGATVLQDLWALSLTGTVAWSELHPTNAPPFMSPPFVTYSRENDALVVWISTPGDCGLHADLWMLPLETMRWRPVSTRGVRPTSSEGDNDVIATRYGLLVWAPDLREPLPWRVDLSAIECRN